MSKAMSHNIESAGTAVAYAVSGTTVFLGLTEHEWGIVAAVVGTIGVIATFSFNVWFKMKYHK